MVHINDLDTPILYRILCLASGRLAENIDEWKLNLPFLQVCTKWYGLFKSYVFSQGFIEINRPASSEDSDSNFRISCVYYADNVIACRSNLGIITGRDRYNCDCMSTVKVKVLHHIHISQYAHVLKNLLALGVGYWLNLSFLSFTAYYNFDNTFLSKEMGLDTISAAASNYIHNFQNRLPNITHLDVYINKDFLLRTTLSILINHYAPRLQHLQLYNLFKSPLPAFSTELTSLSLSLKDSTHYHPSLYAKSLQYLRFNNISSSSFSWWIFHDFTTPGRIEFTNLKTLDLYYQMQTNEERELSEKHSKQTRPYGSHMLQFPKLHNLTLVGFPVDCDVFYTDTIPTHLEKLSIRGNCDSVTAASRLRLTSVNEMFIRVFEEETLNNEFYIAADRYFGYTRIGVTCTVDFNLSIDVKRTVSWVNVTHLELHRIRFDELLQHIPNFYKLQDLSVHNIYLSDECLTIIQSGLEEEEQGKFELLDTRIEYLQMRRVEPGNPHHLLAVLNHLLLRIATLKEVGTMEALKSSFLLEKFRCSFYFDWLQDN